MKSQHKIPCNVNLIDTFIEMTKYLYINCKSISISTKKIVQRIKQFY